MEARHPLGVLIKDAMEANGWSLQDLADRATRAGYPVSRQGLSQLAANPVKSMHAEGVRRMVAATGLPERVVIVAYVRSLGLSWSETGAADPVEALIRADSRLSTEDKQLLLTMVEQMRSHRRPRSEAQQKSPRVSEGRRGFGPTVLGPSSVE